MAYHILYLSYDGLTDTLGQSQVIPYLAGLSQKGYRFTIISFEKNTRFNQHRDSIQKLLAAHKINWYPLTYHKSPPIVSTLYDIYLLQRTAIKLHKEQNFSIVHCRSYITALVGLALKKSFGPKFVFDMRGFWADERIEGGIWQINNPVFKLIYHYFKGKEKEFLEAADYTITLTEAAKKEIHCWQNISNNPIKIQVIPCCADMELFNRCNVNVNRLDQLKKRLKINDEDTVLLYLGSLGTWYMLEEMLDFFTILLKYRPTSRFMFITKDDSNTILSFAKKKGIEEKMIITSAERLDLPNYLSLAHLSLFFIKPVFSKKASSPTKQGELMGMGIPIVCNSGVGDTAEIIQQSGAGAVIASFTEASYHQVCEDLDNILLINSEIIRSGAEQYYSLEKGVDAYLQVYEKLL